MRRALLAALLLGCGDPEPSPSAPPEPPPERETVERVKAYVDENVGALVEASERLCAAAPEDAEGWRDEAALRRMRARWAEARDAYERVEGAIAILFPELDQRVDGRYEHTVELEPDAEPFDGVGFTGMHAIERILWADAISEEVRRFEQGLRGYVEPRLPATDEEAARFGDGLCARLLRDVRAMRDQLGPLALDHQTAWRGVQGSIEEQAEKVALHATGQDESRYAQRTLADMRANLEGGRAVLDAYEPLIEAHPEALGESFAIQSHLRSLEAAYDDDGDALPPVPEGFDPDAPSEAHLATPYGRLFSLIGHESDPAVEGSLARRLRDMGLGMDIPPLARVR